MLKEVREEERYKVVWGSGEKEGFVFGKMEGAPGRIYEDLIVNLME